MACRSCCRWCKESCSEIFNQDLDKSFSYSTKMEVLIRDRHVGLTNLLLQFTMVVFIVGVIFIYDVGYLEFEQASGSVIAHLQGDVVAVSIGKPGTRHFDAQDISYPGLENENVFIGTRIKIHRQKRGICEDHSMHCMVDANCTQSLQGRCTNMGLCEEPSWCNVEESPEIYELDAQQIMIWVQSSIQFLSLAPDRVYSSLDGHPYPELGYDTFLLQDLLMQCEPMPVRYEEVAELGASVEVQVIYECNVDQHSCKSRFRVRRLDTIFDPENIGFGFSHAYYTHNDPDAEAERTLHEMKGIRIFFKSVGTGRKFDFYNTILKCSMSLALLGIPPILTDLLMTRVFPKRKDYKDWKFEISPDFSDELEKFRKAQKEKEDRDKKYQQKRENEEKAERHWKRRLEEHEEKDPVKNN